MYENILLRLSGLVIFSELKNDPAVKSLSDYFRFSDAGDSVSAAGAYSSFVRTLLKSGADFSEYLYRYILFCDNIYVRKYFSGDASALDAQLAYELDFLSELSSSVPSSSGAVPGVVYPEMSNSAVNFREEFLKALPDSPRRGVGVFAGASMFRLGSGGEIIPVKGFAGQRLSELVGYERERRRIIENTKALISGKTASNVLLYGDAGTGKSSTVKAIANEFAADGLRLIELERGQISMIPELLVKVSAEPLKFIIYIDDLTLPPDSAELCVLKTVLEGGTAAERSNSAIYVTSNHRHLVKESASDRNGSDINTQDNLQGVLGLSARFGLCVTFLAPDKELYLNIVKNLAEKSGIPVTDKLISEAEAFAIRRNGRSPRCAKQYVELICAGVNPLK